MDSSYDLKIPHDMKIRIVLLLLIWTASYFFVAKDFDKEMEKRNIPIKIQDGSLHGKVLFVLSPLFVLWKIWNELKFALIKLYVCLPHFGKKNDLSKEELERMVDEYLKEKEDER